MKLLRDGSPPRFEPPPGIDIYERVDPWEDEGFGDPLAESLGFASWAATFFLDLPGTSGWRCYCAVDGDEPLAYVAMHMHDGVAVLALASCLVIEGDGLGQRAVLHRCISRRRSCRLPRRWRSPRQAVRPPWPTARASFGPASRTPFAPSPGSRVPACRCSSSEFRSASGRLHQKDLTSAW